MRPLIWKPAQKFCFIKGLFLKPYRKPFRWVAITAKAAEDQVKAAEEAPQLWLITDHWFAWNHNLSTTVWGFSFTPLWVQTSEHCAAVSKSLYQCAQHMNSYTQNMQMWVLLVAQHILSFLSLDDQCWGSLLPGMAWAHKQACHKAVEQDLHYYYACLTCQHMHQAPSKHLLICFTVPATQPQQQWVPTQKSNRLHHGKTPHQMQKHL